jgi:proteasome alpha subunit
VELFVAEIGDEAAGDQLYRLTYDGQVADEHGFAVMGGAAEVVASYLRERYAAGLSLDAAVVLAVQALGHTQNEKGEAGDRVIPVDDLEVAVLDRARPQARKFRRIRPPELGGLLGKRGPEQPSDPALGFTSLGAGTTVPTTDDPADPTDQVSGDVAPLENPLSGEPIDPAGPPTAPPIAPPAT